MPVLPNEEDVLKPGAGPSPEVAVDIGTMPVENGKTDDIQVEIVDDTPDNDRGRTRRPEGTEADPKHIPEEDEIASYSDNVQKRIKQLKYEFHEERRGREEAIRERDAAIGWAKGLLTQQNQHRAELSQGEDLLLRNTAARLDAQLATARSAYKAAHEAGDSEALIMASEDIARLQAEIVQVKMYRPRYIGQQPQAQPAPAPQPKPAPVQPDPRATAWHQKNPWYYRDAEMTRYASGVHDRMKADGVNIGSD